MVRVDRFHRLVPLLVDVAAVVIFVAIGRSTHDHGVRPSGLASTAWPFLVALTIGWLLVVQRRQRATSVRAGAIVWFATVTLGMVLRVVAGLGTALAFIVVAFVFLGLFIVGWRIALLWTVRLRR